MPTMPETTEGPPSFRMIDCAGSMSVHGSDNRYDCKMPVAISATDRRSVRRYPTMMKLPPLDQWVADSLKLSKLSGAELARRLKKELRREFDRSMVQKMTTGERKVSADEMLAIEMLTRLPPPSPSVARRVPIIDWVQAGQFSESHSQDEGPTIGVSDLGDGDFFALRVSGDSMDRISPEGSIIIVNARERELLPDRCYIFSWRGETTFKRWLDDPERLEPYSINGRHGSIFVKNKKGLSVIGRVRRTVLDL